MTNRNFWPFQTYAEYYFPYSQDKWCEEQFWWDLWRSEGPRTKDTKGRGCSYRKEKLMSLGDWQLHTQQRCFRYIRFLKRENILRLEQSLLENACFLVWVSALGAHFDSLTHVVWRTSPPNREHWLKTGLLCSYEGLGWTLLLTGLCISPGFVLTWLLPVILSTCHLLSVLSHGSTTSSFLSPTIFNSFHVSSQYFNLCISQCTQCVVITPVS